MFVSYTNNGDGVTGKGISAFFTFGKKVTNSSFFKSQVTNFVLLTDNLCDNAQDLANGILNVEDNWPEGTYCQWLISAQDDNGYVTLEFQNVHVRNSIAIKKYLIM